MKQFNLREIAKTHLHEEAYAFLERHGINWTYKQPLGSNTKLAKGSSVGFAMLPHTELNTYLKDPSVRTVCALATTAGCDKECLGVASGHYSMKKGNAHFKLIKASLMYHYALYELLNMLETALDEIDAKAEGEVGVRLNVFSDVNWGLDVLHYENIRFYDYTKVLSYRKAYAAKDIEYELAYSAYPKMPIRHLRIALEELSYSAWVVPKESKDAIIAKLNERLYDDDIVAVDGDLTDNFYEYKEQNKHTLLILAGKASKKEVRNTINIQFKTWQDIIKKINEVA